jgi:hypothetical protein
LLVTNSGFQGRVHRWVVVIKEPVVFAPQLPSFSSHFFSQASQSITVKVRVVHSVRRNKFPFTLKKRWTCSLLNSGPTALLLLFVNVGSSTATVVALFLDHNRKSNFRHPLWSYRWKLGPRLAFTRSSRDTFTRPAFDHSSRVGEQTSRQCGGCSFLLRSPGNLHNVIPTLAASSWIVRRRLSWMNSLSHCPA